MTIIRIENPWHHGAPATLADALVIEQGKPVVVVTEIAENPGISITNNAEAIVKEMQRRHGPDVLVIEHYNDSSYAGGRGGTETFDLVSLDERGAAKWRHLGASAVEALAALAVTS